MGIQLGYVSFGVKTIRILVGDRGLMNSTNSTEWLTNQIIDYVKDNIYRYAIALEGAWGSGKTRYLETTVSSVLKSFNKQLVRVSLFGIKDANELYGKLLPALFCIGENEKGKKRTVIKESISQIPSIVSMLASKAGLSFSLNVNAKTIIDLLIQDRHVIVFDDVERRDMNADDMSLFGAINDLVEGKNIKVILVFNDIDSKDNQRTLDKDIREKLVWRIFSYKPSPESLVDDIFGNLNLNTGAIDCLACIKRAAIKADCSNVRAMIRAESFIREICSIPALDDDSIAVNSRNQALIDAIQLALLKCKGEILNVIPVYEEGHKITSGYLDYIARRELCEKYIDFPCIDEYFSPRYDCKSTDIEDGFKAYVSKRYYDSPETVELLQIKDDLAGFSEMDDKEIACIIPRFVSTIQKANYSPSLIRDVVTWNYQLTSLGFDGLLNKEELIEACEKTINNSPSRAQSYFNNSAFNFASDINDIETILKSLKEYADTACLLNIKEKNINNIDYSDPNCGIILAQLMDETWSKNSVHILGYSSETIVKTFVSSNGLGQNKIRSIFVKMKSFRFSFMDSPDFKNWLKDIKKKLIDITECENMTKLRKNWFISNLDDLLKEK